MSRYPLALVLGSALFAAEPPASPPAAAAVTTPAAPSRAISAAMADALKAALPKSAFVKPLEKKSDAELPDLRETDKPRNDIVRLPKYVVREQKPPGFTDRELWGEQVFAEKLARRYYPEWYLAFNKVAMWTPLRLFMWSAGASAMARYEEEERLGKMADFADLANMVSRSNSAAGAKVNYLLQGAFMHPSDFGWQGGGSR